MATRFDTWNEQDLLRFLRTFASLSDHQEHVAAADAGKILELDDETTLKALERLLALGCLENAPGPGRGGLNRLGMRRVVTNLGVTAILDNKLPRPTA